MKEKLKVPKLRFKEFSGEWSFVKLDNILEIKLRPTTKPLISYEALGVRCHAKGTFHKEVEDPNSVAIETLYEVKENDLIVNITFAWEHAIAICKKEDEGRLVSHRFPTYVPKDNLSVKFLNYLIKQEFFRYNLELISPGGAGRNRVMNKSKFLEIKLYLPSLPEQQKIADFLSKVDEKIEKLTKKKELLEQYKKGVMQKIFSQEIRFKDENGNDFPEWEEKELGEVFTIQKGQQLNKDDLIEDGIYPAINGGINPSGYTNDYNTNENTITISEGGNSCGYINLIKTKFWSGGHCYALINDDENPDFYYQILKYKQDDIMKLRVGSGLPNIQKKDINVFLIPLVDKAEQQKIADFLSALDKKIDIASQELKQVQEFKKGLLQQMFV